MGTKKCTGCGEVKPVGEFRLRGTQKNGRRYPASTCRACHAAEVRAYRRANLEVVRARELAYSRAHAEQKRENARRWYAEHPERGKANARRRYKEKREIVVADSMMQRARKYGAPEVKRVTRDEIVQRDLGICQICREPVNPTLPRYHPESISLDHIVPLSEGGAHTRENVRLTHLRCNLGRPRARLA